MLSLLPKFLKVKLRFKIKVVLGDVVVAVDVVEVMVIKVLEEPSGRGPHHHPQIMILRFIYDFKL